MCAVRVLKVKARQIDPDFPQLVVDNLRRFADRTNSRFHELTGAGGVQLVSAQ